MHNKCVATILYSALIRLCCPLWVENSKTGSWTKLESLCSWFQDHGQLFLL